VNGIFRFFALLLLFLNFSMALSACTKKEEKSSAGQDNVIRVTGAVRLVGNDPFLELVISESGRDWFIEVEDEQKLRDLQQRTVTIEGIETVTNLRWANGLPAGERYSLKDIKIIEIK